MANPLCAKTYASLRLLGERLDPVQISKKLGLEPSFSAEKGKITRSPSGKSRTQRTGIWIVDSSKQIESTDTEVHIHWLLDLLDRADAVAKQLPSVDDADVFCYWLSAKGHGGPVFSPEIMGRLGHHGLKLGIDIYYLESIQADAAKEEASEVVRLCERDS